MIESTARYGHLKEKPNFRVGDEVRQDDFIGIMGSTGDSTTELHLHKDAVFGAVRGVWRSSQVRSRQFVLDDILMAMMIRKELMDRPFKISHYPHEYEYYKNVGVHHEGYDLIPIDYPPENDVRLFWPLENRGKVLSLGWDQRGYGYYINILTRR